MLTDAQLAKIMPNLAAARRALYLPHLNAAMQANGVTTLLRIAGFVAQLAHESGEFRWMEELWGPSPAQRRYEPANELAKRLGNTEAGDGRRFKGRGPIQITGRFNYTKFGTLLGIDLAAAPELAATPEIAFATAGLFWRSNGLNELADADQFVTITRRINGGTNGLAERQRFYERAKAVLAAPLAATRGAPMPAATLERGYEAIAADRPTRAPAGKAKAQPTAVRKRAARKAAVPPVAAKQSLATQAGAKRAGASKRAAKKAGTPRAALKKPAVEKVTVRAAAPARKR